MKLLALGLSSLVGVIVANTPAQAGDVHLYDVNFQFTTETPICEVYGVPETDLTEDVSVEVLDHTVYVDGAGKITGFAQIQVTSDEGTSVVMANVSGSIGMKDGAPLVTMRLEGTGFASDTTGEGKAKLNVKFTGSPVYDSVSRAYQVEGTYKGSFDPGIKGVKSVSARNIPAHISSDYVSTLTTMASCILQLTETDNKWSIGGCTRSIDGDLFVHPEWIGNGKVNSKGAFNMTIKGTGDFTQSSLTFKGAIAAADAKGERYFTSLFVSGKIKGQKVNAPDAVGSLSEVSD
jgi:hypothetical protein